MQRHSILTLVLLATSSVLIAISVPIVGFVSGFVGIAVLAAVGLAASYGIARFGARRGITGVLPLVAAGAPAFLLGLSTAMTDDLIDPAALAWLACAGCGVAGAQLGIRAYAGAPATSQ